MGVAILKDKDRKSQDNIILSNDSIEVKNIVGTVAVIKAGL